MGLPFNSNSDGQDIVTHANNLVISDDTSFPLKVKTQYANEALHIIWQDIFYVYGGWIYDDTNLTDLPEATTSLVSGQQFYTLPLDSDSLVGIEFQNQGGTWITLVPITIEKIKQNGYAETEFYKTASTPMFYRPVANGFKLYPAANWSASASLKIHIIRDVSSFASTDTTKTPGFDAPFHYGVPLYMALKHAQTNNLPVAGGVLRGGYKTGLYADWFEFRDSLKHHYSERFRQMFPARVRVVDATRDFQ